MNLNLRQIFKGDRVIWGVFIILSLFSLLIVYSATGSLAYRQMGGNTLYYLMRQFGFLLAGFGVMALVVNWVPTKYMSIFSPVLLLIAIVFLIAGLALGINGSETGRTLRLGFISFQPSEFAKLALILYVSRILANNQKSDETLKKAFIHIMIVSFIICGIISISNFSTAALLFLSVMLMMVFGKIKMKFLAMPVLAGIVIVAVFYFIAPHVEFGRAQTIRGRIDRFIFGDENKENGMTQADYAEMAIYKGGTLGRGPGRSEVSNFMPSAYNDFIFAILIEEYGWVSFIVILAYVIFVGRSGVIIRQCNRTYPAFLVSGLTVMITLQAFINMGVAVGILPVTGQPLPWVSMGGTSMLFTAMCIGAILRVSYQNKMEKNNQVVPNGEELPEEDLELVKA